MTLNNKVAQHVICRGCMKSCHTIDVHTSTIFLVNLRQLRLVPQLRVFHRVKYEEKNIFTRRYVAGISFVVNRHSVVHELGCTTRSHNLTSHTTYVAPTIHYHDHDTLHVAQPCCTKLYDQISVRVVTR